MDRSQSLCSFTSVTLAPCPPLWGPRDRSRHPSPPRSGVKSGALDLLGLASDPLATPHCCVPGISRLTSLGRFPT